MNESLGLLEVKGLLGAITMADVMVQCNQLYKLAVQ